MGKPWLIFCLCQERERTHAHPFCVDGPIRYQLVHTPTQWYDLFSKPGRLMPYPLTEDAVCMRGVPCAVYMQAPSLTFFARVTHYVLSRVRDSY